MLWLSKNILYVALVQAVAAVTGSLYFSEVLGFVPCVLCWYQRILMYPIVILITVGILRRDKNLPFYVLPFSILGMAIALYHYFLQSGMIPREIAPCSLGVSCVTKYFEWFGFITVPLLSLTAFAVITISMIIFRKANKK